jgi:hypothetical protein
VKIGRIIGKVEERGVMNDELISAWNRGLRIAIVRCLLRAEDPHRIGAIIAGDYLGKTWRNYHYHVYIYTDTEHTDITNITESARIEFFPLTLKVWIGPRREMLQVDHKPEPRPLFPRGLVELSSLPFVLLWPVPLFLGRC